jgi:hypothetical protein
MLSMWLLLLFLGCAIFPTALAQSGNSTYCGTNKKCNVILNQSLNPNRTAFTAGDDVTVMMRVYYTETISVGDNVTEIQVEQRNLSAMFFPRVDSYTKLVIPGSTWFVA